MDLDEYLTGLCKKVFLAIALALGAHLAVWLITDDSERGRTIGLILYVLGLAVAVTLSICQLWAAHKKDEEGDEDAETHHSDVQ